MIHVRRVPFCWSRVAICRGGRVILVHWHANPPPRVNQAYMEGPRCGERGGASFAGDRSKTRSTYSEGLVKFFVWGVGFMLLGRDVRGR